MATTINHLEYNTCNTALLDSALAGRLTEVRHSQDGIFVSKVWLIFSLASRAQAPTIFGLSALKQQKFCCKEAPYNHKTVDVTKSNLTTSVATRNGLTKLSRKKRTISS